MSIKINLDLVLLKKGISSKDLAMTIGITSANLSILKTGKARAIRFSTLNDICKALDCQPGDILEYIDDDTDGVDSNLENTID
ncbi:helix-turn-helix domain-containing protein [Peptostreptococcus sp.]